jgi:hypothetical protein
LNIEGSPSALGRESIRCGNKIEEWFESGGFFQYVSTLAYGVEKKKCRLAAKWSRNSDKQQILRLRLSPSNWERLRSG